MSKNSKINTIINFITKHPESVASRRICRELLGEARNRIDAEFAEELVNGLNKVDDQRLETYYYLIR
ncbi:MAG TPA: hypothetical protein PLZ08_00435 [Bacillota bacterium]|jgi:hypothetical protein|nr:hypothetical protein [Bacillota bacterium]HOL08687.1 hypothetical protein [Bacillota bacterium]HPO96410.1 hypothetical protein [Bacillota bacterium]